MDPEFRCDLADVFGALHVVSRVEGQGPDVVAMGCCEVDDAVLTGHYGPEIIVHADVAVFPESGVCFAPDQVADRDLMVFHEQFRQTCADESAAAEDQDVHKSESFLFC